MYIFKAGDFVIVKNINKFKVVSKCVLYLLLYQ